MQTCYNETCTRISSGAGPLFLVNKIQSYHFFIYVFLDLRLLFSMWLVALINPFPNTKILDWSKLKECTDVTFKFHENGGKFPNWEENNVGKGEIAH